MAKGAAQPGTNRGTTRSHDVTASAPPPATLRDPALGRRKSDTRVPFAAVPAGATNVVSAVERQPSAVSDPFQHVMQGFLVLRERRSADSRASRSHRIGAPRLLELAP